LQSGRTFVRSLSESGLSPVLFLRDYTKFCKFIFITEDLKVLLNLRVIITPVAFIASIAMRERGKTVWRATIFPLKKEISVFTITINKMQSRGDFEPAAPMKQLSGISQEIRKINRGFAKYL